MQIPSLDSIILKPKRRTGESKVMPGELPATRAAGDALLLVMVDQANDNDPAASIAVAEAAIAALSVDSRGALRASFQEWLTASNTQLGLLL